MQKQSKIKVGVKGTEYDTEEFYIEDSAYREKRNTRLVGNGRSLSDAYQEGFTQNVAANLFHLSDVLILTIAAPFQTDAALSFTFDIQIDGTTTHQYTVSHTFENNDKFYLYLADLINGSSSTTNIKASSIGNDVHVYYDAGISASSYVSLSVLNQTELLVAKKHVKYNGGIRALANWAFLEELVVLTVVPTAEASDPLIDSKTTNTLCQLWRFTLSDDGSVTERSLLYNDYLNYRLYTKPIMRGVEENTCIARIYVTNERLNKMRSFNTRDEGLFAVGPDALSVNPQSALPAPEVYEIKNDGSLPTGGVQYTYRVIGANGSVSLLAPYSNVVYLPEGDLTQDSFYMYGGDEAILSNKSISLRIEGIDVQNERIEVIAIYRGTEFAITDSEIIYEGTIETGVLEITHSAKSGNPISLAELFEDNKVWEYAHTQEIHENALIVGDIAGDLQSVNSFDALVKQYDNSGNTYAGRFNPDPSVYKYLPGTFTNFQGINPLRVLGGQSDGYASGNGIRITYHIDEAVVDSGKVNQIGGNSLVAPTFGTNVPENGVLKRNIIPGSAADPRVNDLHYSNYYGGSNNPIMGAEYFGYQQNEKYRFGITFGKNGKFLPLMFLCDLTMPDYFDTYVVLVNDKHSFLVTPNSDAENTFQVSRYDSGNNALFARSLKIKVDVRLPEVVKEAFDSFKIVRVERNEANKTVTGQGILQQVITYHNTDGGGANDNRYGQGIMEDKYGVAPGSVYQQLANNKLAFVQSPDYVFAQREFIHSGGMKMHYIGNLNPLRLGSSDDFYVHPNTSDKSDQAKNIYNRITVYSNPNTTLNKLSRTDYTIKYGYHAKPGQSIPGSVTGGGPGFLNYSRGPLLDYDVNGYCGLWLNGSTDGALVRPEETLVYNNSNTAYKCLVEFRKPLTNQYGGNTTFALKSNQWIDCAAPVPISETSYLSIIGGGDVVTNMVAFTRVNVGPREAREYNSIPGGLIYGYTGGPEGIAFVCNSEGNYQFAHGAHYGGEPWDYSRAPEHLYNPAFSAKDDARRYIYVDNEEECEDVHNPGVIAVSRNKINGENIDNWLQFPAFDFFDVDLSKGKIMHIVSEKSMLFVVQERGIGVLSYNPLAINQTENGADITILSGSGQKIRKLQYVSEYGTRIRHFRVKGKKGTYIIDDLAFELILIKEDGIQRLAMPLKYQLWFKKMLKGNNNQLDQPLLFKGVHGYFDFEFDEVGITINK